MILENIGPSSDTQSYAYFDKGNGFVDQKLNYAMIWSHQIYKHVQFWLLMFIWFCNRGDVFLDQSCI